MIKKIIFLVSLMGVYIVPSIVGACSWYVDCNNCSYPCNNSSGGECHATFYTNTCGGRWCSNMGPPPSTTPTPTPTPTTPCPPCDTSCGSAYCPPPPVPGQCGSSSGGVYPWTATGPDASGLCSLGSQSTTPQFPDGVYGPDSKVTWTCNYETSSGTCSAYRETLCGAAAKEFNKHYEAPDEAPDDWKGATADSGYFCKAGAILTPSSPLPIFPIPGEEVSWRCNDADGDGNECLANNTTPAPECPAWGDGDDSYTREELEAMDEKELCGAYGLIEQGTEIVINDVYWDWTCEVDTSVIPSGYIGDPTEFFKECGAKNCLASTDFNEELYVYFKGDGKVDPAKFFVETECPNLCCVYKNTSSGDEIEVGECGTLGDDEIVIDGHPDEIEKICKSDECDNPPCEPGICEEVDADGSVPDECQESLTIQCVCTANKCTAQGACAATPVFASSIADANCSSECSADSDCGGGGYIEETN